jgi:hypothetical protein
MENNALRDHEGKALVTPEQNHGIHFDVHMKDVQEHLGEQTSTPIEKLIHAEHAGQHMAKHLAKLEGDPTRKAEVKQKRQQLHDLSKATDQLLQNVQEMRTGRATSNNGDGGQQTGPDPALMKVQGDLALKTKKAEGDMALKARKAQFTERLQDQRTAADIRRQNRRELSQPPNPAL